MPNPSIFKDKNILIGVSAGIAIYKILDLISKLRKSEANVRVVMTKNATQLISPLTFETISQNKVTLDLFDVNRGFQIEHIADAKWGDVLLIAPATADIIGKIANGIADDALTTLSIAFEKDIFISPSMNPAMWKNICVKENIEKLKNRGISIIEPNVGLTACGDEGAGRLPEPAELISILENYFTNINKQDACSAKDILKGKKVLITAGPTREFFDPVRCITNPSSGKMGYAMAEEALRLGGNVVLVSGPSSLTTSPQIKLIKINTAEEMLEKVLSEINDAAICVFTAAVSDYRPESKKSQKIKKSDKEISIKLVKNPDIAFEASKKKKKGMIFIGFAAETQDLLKNAKAKMKTKSFDLIAVNNVLNKDIGFESDFNEITLIDKNGTIKQLPRSTKTQIATEIWERILQIYNK